MQKTTHFTPRIKYIFFFLLFMAALLERVSFDLGPNFELITMAMVLSYFYFGKKESFWLTFTVIALSDLVLGNSNIFLFTWSGFLIPAFFGSIFIQKLKNKKAFSVISLTATGLFANIFFFLWTNLGVWFLGNMYSKSLSGLLMSYINGLPFLKNQIVSTIIFIPLCFVITEFSLLLLSKYHLKLGKFTPATKPFLN